MKKSELFESILFFAEMYGKKENYQALMLDNANPTYLTKEISYDIFMNLFDFNRCTSLEHEHFSRIYKYRQSLDDNGFFDFKTEN